ncbi:MAG: type II toxin-antitoxin system RelE/ParE family toxin [Hyphomonadaceae bacterium]|nr:type II toxin-antitoxin system RelE/ParE family toxin [Hyphomonadaceae bacterium]
MPIKSHKDAAVARFHASGVAPRPWRAIAKAALRKLDMLDAAVVLEDMASPPGNRLEALKGDRKGQYSIRISDQFRICFRWTDDGAEDAEIVDYH